MKARVSEPAEQFQFSCHTYRKERLWPAAVKEVRRANAPVGMKSRWSSFATLAHCESSKPGSAHGGTPVQVPCEADIRHGPLTSSALASRPAKSANSGTCTASQEETAPGSPYHAVLSAETDAYRVWRKARNFASPARPDIPKICVAVWLISACGSRMLTTLGWEPYVRMSACAAPRTSSSTIPPPHGHVH